MRVGLNARPWVGLDIGEYSIKLFSLRHGVGGDRPCASEQVLPAAGGTSPEALGHLLAECFSRSGHSPRSFGGLTLGVSGGDVIIKQVSLPLMDDGEIPGALRFEARKHLPFDPQTCVIDYQLLARVPSEKRLDVLLAAVPQARLERLMAPLKAIGVDPDIVDAAPLALTNAISRSAERETEARVAVDLGHGGSWLTLYQRGEPYFARRLEFGGAGVTRAVAAALRVPLEEAEEWKLEAGADDSSIRVEPESAEMQGVRDSLLGLADELRRSFAYYRTLAPLPEPFTLWISGNTARLPGLAGELSAMLEVPTFVFDPLESVPAETRGQLPAGGPQFALAYGLASRMS
ncbi:MAG: pilus assembly protein PilM [Candidatus Eisenbacteria bacterium]|nr:pilus assembly protein PilM [Candidatus Eisenbacteria bacterium]